MDKILEATRNLGKLIQDEDCFKRYIESREKNDNDEELQKAIGEFNLVKLSMDQELAKEERDAEKLKALNDDLRRTYSEVMINENMINFQTAKREVDELVAKIYSVIVKCSLGENPETAEFEESCGGDCASCGGCH